MEAHSHTTRQTYLACPRKFYLSKMLRLERDIDVSALRMGRAMADALEAAGPHSNLRNQQAAAQLTLHAIFRKAIDKAAAEGKGGEVDRLELEQVQLSVLVPEYLARFGQSLAVAARSQGGSVVNTGREIEFDDPILGPGRLDAVVMLGGLRVGIEDKLLTAGFWRGASERQLRINAQVTAYFAAMRAAGTPLDELRYRVTFKPTIKPNSRKGESLQEYADRLRERVRSEPDYAFREYQLFRTDAELDAFVRRVEGVNRMIARSKRDLKRHGHDAAFPANMGNACLDFGECEFLELCVNPHSATGYRVRPKRPKLTDFQLRVLEQAEQAFHDELRVADVTAMMAGQSEQRVRDALNRLVVHGLATKERRGRAAVYSITDAGREFRS